MEKKKENKKANTNGKNLEPAFPLFRQQLNLISAEIERDYQKIIIDSTREAKNILQAMSIGVFSQEQILRIIRDATKNISDDNLQNRIEELEKSLEDKNRDDKKIDSLLRDIISTVKIRNGKKEKEIKKLVSTKRKKKKEPDLLSYQHYKRNFAKTTYSKLAKNQSLKFTETQKDIIYAIFDLAYRGRIERKDDVCLLTLENKSELFQEILEKKERAYKSPSFSSWEIKKYNRALSSLNSNSYHFYFLDEKGKLYREVSGPPIYLIDDNIKSKFILTLNPMFFNDASRWALVISPKYVRREIKNKCPYIQKIQDTHMGFIRFLYSQSTPKNPLIIRKYSTLVEILPSKNLKNKLKKRDIKTVLNSLKELFQMARDAGFLKSFNEDKDTTIFDLNVNWGKIKKEINQNRKKTLTFQPDIDEEARKEGQADQVLLNYESLTPENKKEFEIFYIRSNYAKLKKVFNVQDITPAIRESLGWICCVEDFMKTKSNPS